MSGREALRIAMWVVHCCRLIAQVVNKHYLVACWLQGFLQEVPVFSIRAGVTEVDLSENRSFFWQLLCSILAPSICSHQLASHLNSKDQQAEDEILLDSSSY